VPSLAKAISSAGMSSGQRLRISTQTRSRTACYSCLDKATVIRLCMTADFAAMFMKYLLARKHFRMGSGSDRPAL